MAQLTKMMRISLGDLESHLGVRKFPAFIAACEERFAQDLAIIAEQILDRGTVHVVFVSGPTSSGKTTFSHLLAQLLHQSGRPARVLSLDDYYGSGPATFDEQMRPDYESIDMLDTRALVADLNNLFKGRLVSLPTFDFVQRKRIYEPQKRLTLNENDILIIEGLHSLSRQIIDPLPAKEIFGIFIMPWCTFLEGRQLLGSRDLRVLRRISRDTVHRGSTALSTLDYWPMIDRTERRFFPAYLAGADAYFNSCLPYEFCIIPPRAALHIRESLALFAEDKLPDSVYMLGQKAYADLDLALEEATALLAATSKLPQADSSMVPEQSLLKEFF